MTEPRESPEYAKFRAALSRLSASRVAIFLAQFFTRGLKRRSKPTDRPWDPTPANVANLSRFLVRHAVDAAGETLAEADLGPLMKAFYNLKDPRNEALVRSHRPEEKFELSLRQDYARSFHDVRPDLYGARMHQVFSALEGRGVALPTLFGLGREGIRTLPYGILELLRGGRVDLDADRLAPFLPPASFPDFAKAVSLTKAEFDRRFDAGFDPGYFETAYNPLAEYPCLRVGEKVIPVAPHYLFQRLPDLYYDAAVKASGYAFAGEFNAAVLDGVQRLLARFAPRAKVSPLPGEAGAAASALLIEEAASDPVAIQIVPNRVSGLHASTCNVFNIYDRTAAIIAPSVLGLVDRLEKLRAGRRVAPAVVTFQPLYVGNISHLEACVTRILRDEYQIPAARLSRLALLDAGELELALVSLPAFRDLSDLFERKRDKEYRTLTFGDYLKSRLGARLREEPSVTELEQEMQGNLRAILKRHGVK